jgi:hypothetical protein
MSGEDLSLPKYDPFRAKAAELDLINLLRIGS